MSEGYMYCLISLNRCPPIQNIKQNVEQYWASDFVRQRA